ncbi:glycosyltransferase family 4 protein [Hoeflea prorocentri]|uniref:Glycosyltransferase family 4 protein n=1 Tax=Hoeflea prorocentri TaxID=1922333 RepID=A0A9X3UJS5_9HYPH|nr:glycosyltransferase family 4 protein [Hoeflea prorocentri]MCY6380419.1 glycosyltransferase family 4 protein [Hoeflea prorocentri]MDA5398219.1 glycosyltransferase family 4 protein [Hoeflea prorocentri]
MSDHAPLRIVHCFRSPVGGIFRHVRDLVRYQHEAGHKVGILCDSITGGAHEDALFDTIRPFLNLGLTRVPMHRSIGPGDIVTALKCRSEIKSLKPDIIHGHGAKGGAMTRLVGSQLRVSRSRVSRLYSPHGGSLHYSRSQLSGRFYFALERFLERFTDGLVFVSDYERQAYTAKIGPPRPPSRLIYNGLHDKEFEDITPEEGAADFLYVGMMRDLKGPDVFIDALGKAEKLIGKPLSAMMIGDGDDKDKYRRMLEASGQTDRVKLEPAMPVRDALRRGEFVVVPSRAESLPYLVLETLAAGRPVIATRVGGIPEIFGVDSPVLIPPGNADALAKAMANTVGSPRELMAQMPDKMDLETRFSARTMANQITDFYRDCTA